MTFFCLWCNAPFEEGQAPAPCPKAPEYASKLAVADVRWAGCTPIVCIMCGEPLTELRAPCKVDPLHRTCAQTLVIESREAVEAAGNGPPLPSLRTADLGPRRVDVSMREASARLVVLLYGRRRTVGT